MTALGGAGKAFSSKSHASDAQNTAQFLKYEALSVKRSFLPYVGIACLISFMSVLHFPIGSHCHLAHTVMFNFIFQDIRKKID